MHNDAPISISQLVLWSEIPWALAEYSNATRPGKPYWPKWFRDSSQLVGVRGQDCNLRLEAPYSQCGTLPPTVLEFGQSVQQRLLSWYCRCEHADFLGFQYTIHPGSLNPSNTAAGLLACVGNRYSSLL